MIVLYILYAFLAIGVIIFLHELGHFLAAKKVGVRVDRFLVGFDPPLFGRPMRFFSFKKGDTEYALGMVPFGGYVKLAGESELSEDKTGAPDELMSKSVGARALVFAAGAIMNIVTAFLFFAIAFSVGVEFTEPRIGRVIPGTPAWEAGLAPGDRIVAVDGEEVIDFIGVQVNVALANGPVEITVDRAGAEKNISVTPELLAGHDLQAIGIAPPLSSVINAVDGSAAEEAGIQDGDRATAIRIGRTVVPLESGSDLRALVVSMNTTRGREPYDIEVERNGTKTWHTLRPRENPEEDRKPQIGIVHGPGTVVRDVRTGTAASSFFNKGDRVLRLQGQPISAVSIHSVLSTLQASPDDELTLEIEPRPGSGNPVRTAQAAGSDLLRWLLNDDIEWTTRRCRLGEIVDDSPLAPTFETGDVIVAIEEKPCFSPTEIAPLVPNGATTIRVTLRRSDAVLEKEIDPTALTSEAVPWRTLAPLGAVTQNGPAAAIGLAAGDTITKVGGKAVNSWEDLVENISDREVGSRLDLAWVTADGAQKEGTVEIGLAPMATSFEFKSLQSTVTKSPLAALALGGRRTITVSKWVFLTVRGLFSRQIPASKLQGPLGITTSLTIVSERGFGTLLYFMALISVNLGIFNLFPFPILDGGHLLFLLIEKIKGSPVSLQVQEWAMRVALLLILSLAIFVTFHDIRRLFMLG